MRAGLPLTPPPFHGDRPGRFLVTRGRRSPSRRPPHLLPGRKARPPAATNIFLEDFSGRFREVPVADANPEGSGGDGAEPDPRFTFANERTFLAVAVTR